MAYQEVFRVDTRELTRLWQKGQNQRRIARISGRARDTAKRYVNAAKELGLEPGGPEPTDEQLAALNLSTPATVITPAADTLEPHTELIGNWLARDKCWRSPTPPHQQRSQKPRRSCSAGGWDR